LEAVSILVFALVWLIQFIFTALVYSRLLFVKPGGQNSIQPISLVIAVKDDFQNLKALVEALLKQEQAEFEVVVIDDRSDIDTHLAMKAMLEPHSQFKLLQVKDCPSHIHPKKYAITLGIKAAKHPRILLTDADCLPKSPLWISMMSRQFDVNTDFVLAYSSQGKQRGFLNSFVRYETFVTGVQYLSLAASGMPYMGVGRNLAYTKDVFIRNNGFGKFQAVVGGDDDLFVNLHAKSKKTKILFDYEAQTTTLPKNTLSEYFIQKKRHLSVSKHYRFGHKLVLGLANASHLFMLPAAVFASACSSFVWIGFLGVFLWTFLRHLVFFMIKKRFKESVEMHLFFIHDLIFSVYILLVGSLAITAKTVRWK
jgi:glycosyltransferase involved in cell wall biosynthesis